MTTVFLQFWTFKYFNKLFKKLSRDIDDANYHTFGIRNEFTTEKVWIVPVVEEMLEPCFK